MAKKDWMIVESELDDDQLKVLIATNDKSCIVSGCAGSGKSVLALIKAQRIQKEKGDNYQIIVYTTALCDYMNAGREMLGLKNTFYYYKEWKWKRAPKTYANGSTYMVYLKDSDGDLIPNMPKADYVIVDEIQDFTKDEVQDFITATNKNFFFFGDMAQSIYKDKMPIQAINRLFSYDREPKNFTLYRNYRLPIPVARIVQYVGVDIDLFDEKTYKSHETAVPKFLKYPSLKDQVNAIANIIKRNNLTDVGILLPHNEDVGSICTLLNENEVDYEVKFNDKQNWHNSVNNLNFNTTNPKVMTYHSAKGLQFEAVFLPDIKPLFSDGESQNISEQKALYVAMTRTYRYLFVMYSGCLPAPLDKVPSKLYSTSEIDTIKDI